MRLNAIFDNVKIYDVQSQLDVVQGEVFDLEILEGTPEVFTNNDQILDLSGTKVTASEIGSSLIRFMDGTAVVKDLTINVVASTGPVATTLGGSLGEPVQK
jgi:hypothetical protein